MEKLVSHGANVNLSNRKGVSALMEAVKQAALEDSSSLKTIDMLLSAEADPNVCDELLESSENYFENSWKISLANCAVYTDFYF